ncbi:MAG: hypothetical protein IKE53_02615 [Clostridiales bacterium]|nr:hypothetical protein [Clostridiales bacterium]
MAEKKKGRVARVLFIIALMIETPIAAIMLFGIAAMVLTGKGDVMPLIGVTGIAVGFVIVDAFQIKKVHYSPALVISNAIVLKLAAFCFGGIIFYLAPSIHVVKAAVIFAVLFAVCAVASAAIAHDINERYKTVPVKPGRQLNIPNVMAFDFYDAKDHAADARSEFCAIYGGPEDESSPEFEREILEYASMPIIYLVMWLSERGYIKLRFEDGISPLETFGSAMEYRISRKDIAPDIIPFLDSYVRTFSYYSASCDYFLFDYYEAVKNADNAYYCNEFSVSAYRQIRDRLDRRYEEYLINKPVYYTGLSTYEDGRKRDYEIRTIGNVDSGYVSRCDEMYNSLSLMQKERIERYIATRFMTAVDIVHGLEKLVLTVSEQKQDHLQFTVTGEFKVKMPVVFSYFVRNGICFVPEYDRDYGFTNIDIAYDLASDDKDLYLIDSRERVDEAVSRGNLLKKEVNGKDMLFTPALFRIYGECMRRIDTLNAIHKNVTHIVKPEYRNGCLVPVSLRITASNGSKEVFREHVDNIWY